MPKMLSEAVNRRTDNAMVKGKRTNMIYKTLHRKLRIEQHESHLKPGELRSFEKGEQVLLH
jgi:hypothetical protein